MSKPPAFQFYADDFLAGTCDMTQGEIGAYILLLCHQWNKGVIPLDITRLSILAKGEVTEHVFAKFPNGKNERMEKVRVEREAFCQRQSEAGRRGMAKRWNNQPYNDPNKVVITGLLPEDNSPVSSLQSPSVKKEVEEKSAKESRTAAKVDDSQWLEGLKNDPAYTGLDVAREFAKMARWCEVNRKQPSRKRFVNWLNRAENPMSAQSKSNHNQKSQFGF